MRSRSYERETNQGLRELRGVYHDRKPEFTPSIVESLRELAQLLKALEGFAEELMDCDDILIQQEVDDAMGRLHERLEGLEELPVAGRIKKEIRELVERRGSCTAMPIGKSMRLSTTHGRACHRTLRNAASAMPRCC